MTVSDNTKEAESLGDLFKNLVEKGLKVSKKMSKNIIKNPGRALDITTNIATAAASRKPKNVMSTLPELITCYNTGKRLYLSNVVYIMLDIWKKKQIDYTQAHHLKLLIKNKAWTKNLMIEIVLITVPTTLKK